MIFGKVYSLSNQKWTPCLEDGNFFSFLQSQSKETFLDLIQGCV
jgi:hypothetical protein